MDSAVTAANAVGRNRTRQAIKYRDGLVISTLAMVPLRRGTLAALQIGRHLIKVRDHWELDIPAADTKTGRPLDYSIPKDLSARIDLYLERFRNRIRGSHKHAGLWPSHHSIPMRPDSINVAVQKRTKKAFGFGVNLHRFRHAAATFGPSKTRSTCEASRTFSVKHHLPRPKNTTSWRNRVLRGWRSLKPSAGCGNDSQAHT